MKRRMPKGRPMSPRRQEIELLRQRARDTIEQTRRVVEWSVRLLNEMHANGKSRGGE